MVAAPKDVRVVDLLRRFGVNLDAEKTGVWHDLGGGLRVKVARWGNPAFARRFEELVEPHRADMEAGPLSDDVDREIMATVMAETILMDWQGIELDGKPLPYTTEAAREILARPELRDFKLTIQKLANRAAKYRAAATAADGKNSSGPSSGS